MEKTFGRKLKPHPSFQHDKVTHDYIPGFDLKIIEMESEVYMWLRKTYFPVIYERCKDFAQAKQVLDERIYDIRAIRGVPKITDINQNLDIALSNRLRLVYIKGVKSVITYAYEDEFLINLTPADRDPDISIDYLNRWMRAAEDMRKC